MTEQNLPKRPISLTILAWLFIVAGILTPLALLSPQAQTKMQEVAIPQSTQYLLNMLNAVFTLTSGIAILKGREWGRYLYVGWAIASLVISFVTTSMKHFNTPGLIFLGIAASFLFSEKANQYFWAMRSQIHKMPNTSDTH